jgi:ferredoxin
MKSPIYEIGKRYMVPCVRLTKFFSAWGIGEYVPVLLAKHEDTEIVNFPWQHYHIDWRFVGEREFKYVADNRIGNSGVYGLVVSEQHAVCHEEPPVYRRKVCKREMPDWPHHIAKWAEALDAEYADKKLTACGKCPHRGVDLSTIEPRILDLGKTTMKCVKVCPGHGLVWDQDGQHVSHKELYEK